MFSRLATILRVGATTLCAVPEVFRLVGRRSTRVVAGVMVIGGLAAACGGGRHIVASPPSTAVTPATALPVTAPPTAPRAKVAARTVTCPLTGLPAPGGRVPPRPALAVKVENLPEARPQYGLSTADIVYEEPVEGGITRFIVIYQCQDASRIEPVRSGRLIDPDIVRQYGAHPLFAYAGAIGPVVTKVDSSSLVDVGIYRAPLSAYWRDGGRYVPHNLVSDTAALYAAGVAQHAPEVPPQPVFPYGALPAHSGAASININYLYSDLTWTWLPGQEQWQRSYVGAGPAGRGEGGDITTTNVVVMKVVMYPSPYVEDATGIHENELVLTGSGPVQVFRNGAAINGTWVRPTLNDNTRFLDAAGHPIPLQSGPTWVELVPTTVPVTVTG